ncbi:MAG: hypothetical protein R3B72_33415 [Polyangiaceae bacterium]
MMVRALGTLTITGFLCIAAACGSNEAPTGTGGAVAGTGSGAGGDASGGGIQSGSGGDIGLGGGLGQGGGGEEDGCGKVDFLFIIDNSVSMGDQQSALIQSFPGFMSAIQTTLEITDYHIMVADTDDQTRCTPDNCMTGNMGAQNLCIDAANGYACQTNLFDTCDNTIGAGVVHPAGDGASNMPCTIFGGHRYIVEGEPDLVGTFSCAAQVGLAGHPSERPMDSLVAAMSDTLNGPGGCNEGFLRDDAILVVTFISDDPNYEDAGVPQDWYDAVVAAKGGNPEAVVVLGLTPNFPDCPGNGTPKGSHWSEFVALWGARGLEASVCNLDYAPFFEQAVSVIDTTCDGFMPQ